MKDVFISYSTRDQAAKDELVALFGQEGISYFLDANDLDLGKDIEQSLKEHLKDTRFTILLVSKNSLLSTWVGMETMFRLGQEKFFENNSLICVIVETGVLDIRFSLEMQKEYTERRKELEEIRNEMYKLGGQTEIYDIEIRRVDKINVSDMMIKVRNHLGAVLNDPARKEKDLKKLLDAIKASKQTSSEAAKNLEMKGIGQKKVKNTMDTEQLRALANQGKIQELLDVLDALFEESPHYSYSQIRQNLQFSLMNQGIAPNQMQGLLAFLGSHDVKTRLGI